MAGIRGLGQASTKREQRPRRLLTETRASVALDYALVVFVVSLIAGFALPILGVPILDIYDDIMEAIDSLRSAVPG